MGIFNFGFLMLDFGCWILDEWERRGGWGIFAFD
jgi:hypothetical protein